MRKPGVCLAVMLGALAMAASTLAAPRNRIAITISRHIKSDTVYNVTVHGFARRSATAYLFVDYRGCARRFAVERRRASGASDVYHVKGNFAELSGWKSSSAGTDHACAYLIRPHSTAVLARSRVSFRIH
jgi:hypothetical protein